MRLQGRGRLSLLQQLYAPDGAFSRKAEGWRERETGKLYLAANNPENYCQKNKRNIK